MAVASSSSYLLKNEFMEGYFSSSSMSVYEEGVRFQPGFRESRNSPGTCLMHPPLLNCRVFPRMNDPRPPILHGDWLALDATSARVRFPMGIGVIPDSAEFFQIFYSGHPKPFLTRWAGSICISKYQKVSISKSKLRHGIARRRNGRIEIWYLGT